MTPQEEQRLLRSVRGIYNYKVGGPIIVFLFIVLIWAGLVFSFLLVGVGGWLARLSPFFFL